MNICNPEQSRGSTEVRLPVGNRLYLTHELSRRALGLVNLGVALTAASAKVSIEAARRIGFTGPILDQTERRLAAMAEMSDRMAREYPKPEYGLESIEIGGEQVAVKEVVVDERAFGDLLHFERQTDRDDPPVLLVAPMSGHYATLLRDTVRQLLPSHDVFITDWKNARDVPVSKGQFDLDEYISYMVEWIKRLGPETNVVAVCQATVPSLAAISYLAENESDSQPQTMTLMGGPLDVAVASTSVTDFANRTSIDLIEQSWIDTVPSNYPGRGRRVYPGFVQLNNFMAMNRQKHLEAHFKLLDLLTESDIDPSSEEAANKIKEFYNEYFAVADLPAEFYLQTVQKVFKERALAEGTMTYQGRLINPGAIDRTALLTIEGAEDDISAPGQTLAVHDQLKSLEPSRQFHYTQEGVGHYGIFNGKTWATHIAPRIAGFIRAIAQEERVVYDEPASEVVMPSHK